MWKFGENWNSLSKLIQIDVNKNLFKLMYKNLINPLSTLFCIFSFIFSLSSDHAFTLLDNRTIHTTRIIQSVFRKELKGPYLQLYK